MGVSEAEMLVRKKAAKAKAEQQQPNRGFVDRLARGEKKPRKRYQWRIDYVKQAMISIATAQKCLVRLFVLLDGMEKKPLKSKSGLHLRLQRELALQARDYQRLVKKTAILEALLEAKTLGLFKPGTPDARIKLPPRRSELLADLASIDEERAASAMQDVQAEVNQRGRALPGRAERTRAD